MFQTRFAGNVIEIIFWQYWLADVLRHPPDLKNNPPGRVCEDILGSETLPVSRPMPITVFKQVDFSVQNPTEKSIFFCQKRPQNRQ